MTQTVMPFISEREFAEQIRHIAQLLGYRRFHSWTSIRSPSGWPDEALVRPPRLILAELKSERGKVTPAQAEWLDALAACPGVEVCVWRPSMLDAIVEYLRPLDRPGRRTLWPGAWAT